MSKRLLDIAVSALALTAAIPVLVIVPILIRLSDGGPVLYRSSRVGVGERTFTLFKFRSMRANAEHEGSISGVRDNRTFTVGRLLRISKLDEIPQFLNVLRGEMSVVGPRPEDPKIVADFFTLEHRRTLTVRPGMTSPGSIFNFTHGGEYIDDRDVQNTYVIRLLPIKLGLELVYVDRARLLYDLQLIARTIVVICAMLLGRRRFDLPPEYFEARSKGYFGA